MKGFLEFSILLEVLLGWVASMPSTSMQGRNLFYSCPQCQCPTADKVLSCKPCHNPRDCPYQQLCCSDSSGGFSCTNPVGRFMAQPDVIPLIAGYQTVYEQERRPEVKLEREGSATLIKDNGHYILVDTGSGTSRDHLVRRLAQNGIRTSDIAVVVLTHGHPDHVSNAFLFPWSKMIVSGYQFIGNSYEEMPPATKDEGYNICTRNIELYSTPGHTSEDISVVVRNATALGNVAITGDLVYSANDFRTPINETKFSLDPELRFDNRNILICCNNISFVVPGHGLMFPVIDEMKEGIECE